MSKDNLVIDFQTNGMYDGLLFDDPVEHDFILGAKDEFEVGDGKLSIAAQGLIATHQKDSAELMAINKKDNPESTTPNVADYFGYSTDVWYRTGDFDGIQNMAGAVKVGYKADLFDVNVVYRFRGVQASMLYLRENHDDGTFDLSDTLGVLNSQAINFNGALNLLDGALGINLGATAEMALEKIEKADDA